MLNTFTGISTGNKAVLSSYVCLSIEHLSVTQRFYLKTTVWRVAVFFFFICNNGTAANLLQTRENYTMCAPEFKKVCQLSSVVSLGRLYPLIKQTTVWCTKRRFVQFNGYSSIVYIWTFINDIARFFSNIWMHQFSWYCFLE